MVYINYKITILHKELKKKNLFEGTTPEPLLGGGSKELSPPPLDPLVIIVGGGFPPTIPHQELGSKCV